MHIQGSLPALITPFCDHSVDYKALENLVDWQIQQGSDGLVPVGTTGESPTLSHKEHEEVIRQVTQTADGRVPVIAGAGSNSTMEAMRFVNFAEKVGAHAALVVTPYYNKPTQDGLYQHFKTLHDDSNLPIIIYNIPGRSVVDMTPETMGQLSELPRIIGVKDATGDVVRVSEQRRTCGKDFIQLSGEDASALGFNSHGGKGCVSVTANVAPKLCAEFQAAMLAGDHERALEYQDRLLPLHAAIFAEPGLAGAKFGLSLLGLCRNEMRLPLLPVSKSVEDQIRAAMGLAGLID